MDEPIVPYQWSPPNPDEWKTSAACRSMDPDIFFGPEKGGGWDQEPALAICATCPVEHECLEYALQRNDPGVWGGMSERQRQRLKKMRRTQGRAA